MVSDQEPPTSKSYSESELLRREAGEGWHPNGLNNVLLGALVSREVTLDEIITRQGSEAETAAELWEQYEQQLEIVRGLKEKYAVDDPPPRSP